MNSIMETIRSACQAVKDAVSNGISFHKLLVALRREFRLHNLQIKLTSVRDKTMNVEEFYVNAYYDSEDDSEGEVPIEVNVHHNFEADTIWDQQHVTEMLIQVFDAVVHEYKHQNQSIKRKYKTFSPHIHQPYHAYLADQDEVDAYAFSIAIELARTLGKYRALRLLSKFSGLCKLKFRGKYVSPSLSAYYGQFGSVNNVLMKRLSKKIYVRLHKVDTDSIFM